MRHFTTEEDLLIKEACENKTGYKAIARILKCDYATVKRRCKDLGLTMDYRLKNKNLNSNFFNKIDSEEKAYLLGLIYTDGSVRKKGNSGQLRIQLQLRDEEMILKIKKLLNADNNLIYDKRIGKECVSLEISDKQLYEDLVKHGIVDNKTYSGNHLPEISEDLLIPFLRGLFDGDGIFSFKENYNEVSVGFVSFFEENVLQFQEIIDKLINKTKHNKITYKNSNGSSYTCSWRGRRQCLKILHLLYDNSNIYLERKYNKFLRLSRIKI